MNETLFQQMADIQNPNVVAYLNILNASKLPGYNPDSLPTEDHHGIPQSFYKLRGLPVDNNEDNLFTLIYADHQKAHKLLVLIAKDEDFRLRMCIARNMMLGRPEDNGVQMKKLWSNPDYKEKMRSINKEAQNRPDVQARRKKSLKAAMNKPEIRKKLNESLKKSHCTPEYRARLSEITKKALSTPEAKLRLSEGIKKAFSKPEVKAKLASNAAKQWSNDEIRSKMIDGIKAKWANPDYKESLRSKISEACKSDSWKESHCGARNVMNNPEVRARQKSKLAQEHSLYQEYKSKGGSLQWSSWRHEHALGNV